MISVVSFGITIFVLCVVCLVCHLGAFFACLAHRPISDNVCGIAGCRNLMDVSENVLKIPDAAGNTTAAIGMRTSCVRAYFLSSTVSARTLCHDYDLL